MKNKRIGRPKKKSSDKQTEVLPIRLSLTEKEGFQLAADISGISLSSWARERLRLTAIRELEQAGRHVPFIPSVPLGGNDV